MTRRDQIILALVVAFIALVGTLAGAWATYEGPAHAEEKRWELAERARRLELVEQQKRTAARRRANPQQVAQTKAAGKTR